MINFIDGKIDIDEKNILAASNEELNSLAEKGVIEKRKDAVGSYYYLEDERRNMRFGIFISLREKKIDWVRFSWLDSPCKGWEDVSDKAMMDEYRLLSNFLANEVGGLPDSNINRKTIWRFTWGQLEVSYEPRAYQADIFMKPR